jgi:HptB-dependent secretion and biofilm anti anti-sigma factor
MQTSTNVINGKAVLTLHGRFDFSAHRVFRGTCNESLGSQEVRELEVDLGGVDYLDSSALGMLLMLKEHADAVSKPVILSNCRGTVKQVLDIANFDRIFSIA